MVICGVDSLEADTSAMRHKSRTCTPRKRARTVAHSRHHRIPIAETCPCPWRTHTYGIIVCSEEGSPTEGSTPSGSHAAVHHLSHTSSPQSKIKRMPVDPDGRRPTQRNHTLTTQQERKSGEERVEREMGMRYGKAKTSKKSPTQTDTNSLAQPKLTSCEAPSYAKARAPYINQCLCCSC